MVKEIDVKDIRGRPVVISPPEGRVRVLNVWATWCPPCRAELPSLQRLSDTLDPARFEVMGLALDDDDHLVREFLLERKITYPNYLDVGSKVVHGQWGLFVVPVTLLIAADGTLRHVIAGERDWAGAEVLALIRSLDVPSASEPVPGG